MTETFPPPNFVQTKSAVSGITVYMPKPPDAQAAVVDFRCPNCTATTAYSTDDGGLTCTHCGYHEVPEAEIVGRQAEEFEFTVETLHRSAHGWGAARKELVCSTCAAHTTLPDGDLTHTCPFCGSNKVIQTAAVQDVLRPRFLLPFQVTTDQCRQISTDWLSDSWMLPDDLRRLGRSTEYTPIYVPFWTFDADAAAEWRAQVPKTRQRRGKTETVWVWEKGQVHRHFDDALVYGTTKISEILLDQIRPFDLNALVTYDPSYLAGIQSQAYDVQLEAAWTKARQAMRLHTKQACKEDASSRRLRNFSMNLNFTNESWRYMLLPLYLASYPYGDKTYQVVINGQTGRIAGQRPVSWQKIARRLLLMLLPGVLLSILAVLLSRYEIDTGLMGLVALVAIIAAVLYAAKVVNDVIQMGRA